MTAAWVDSISSTITISDSSNDDDDESTAAAADRRTNNDASHPAAESADTVAEGDAAKPSDWSKVPDATKPAFVEESATAVDTEPAASMDVEPSMESTDKPSVENTEKSTSMEIQLLVSGQQHAAAASSDISNPTAAESVGMSERAEAMPSVDPSTGSPSINIPDESPVSDSRPQPTDANGPSNAAAGDHVLLNGLCPLISFHYCH